MLIDKDLPHTWIKYKDSMCRDCIGTCCTMPVEVKIEDLVRLEILNEDDVLDSRRKVVNRLKKEGIIQSYRDGTGMFMLTQRPNGDCLFLDEKSRLCTVYEKRPNTCRGFPKTMGNRLGYCPQIKKYR